MSITDQIKEATDTDKVMWCHKTLEDETDICYAKIPGGHLVYVPSTNLLKLWSTENDALHVDTVDMSSHIGPNMQRFTNLAVATRDR